MNTKTYDDRIDEDLLIDDGQEKETPKQAYQNSNRIYEHVFTSDETIR